MSITNVIRTKRSLLNSVSEEDMFVFREIFDDAETRRFLPELYELLNSSDGIQKFISTFELYAQNDEGYLWGIRYNYELVGFIAVMDISDDATLFYATHPNFRSSGCMKDAISAVMDYLRKSSICTHVSTSVCNDNSVSINILQQLGFVVCKEDDDKVYLSKVLKDNKS